jgi:carbonic anhydrase/acetyltransferase-like protein (isoleucine patch superfamily)
VVMWEVATLCRVLQCFSRGQRSKQNTVLVGKVSLIQDNLVIEGQVSNYKVIVRRKTVVLLRKLL